MKFIETKDIKYSKIENGEFNACEHTFLECEPEKYQTISVKLPNGKFVSFAFIPASENEMECVDIHTTAGNEITDKNGDRKYIHHAIGFAPQGRNSFDTRRLNDGTLFLTVLLNKDHFPN